jgi:hypothetical protein
MFKGTRTYTLPDTPQQLKRWNKLSCIIWLTNNPNGVEQRHFEGKSAYLTPHEPVPQQALELQSKIFNEKFHRLINQHTGISWDIPIE